MTTFFFFLGSECRDETGRQLQSEWWHPCGTEAGNNSSLSRLGSGTAFSQESANSPWSALCCNGGRFCLARDWSKLFCTFLAAQLINFTIVYTKNEFMVQWDVFYTSHEDTQPWNCWQGATVTLHLGTIPACLQRIHTIRSSKRCAWVLRQNATSIHVATRSMLLRCPSLRLVRATLSSLLLCERESRDKHRERKRQNLLWQRKDFAELGEKVWENSQRADDL